MRLNQAQVRNLAGVSEETLRVWRNALPALRQLSGRTAQITLGDAVDVAVIRSLVTGFGVKVQKLAPASVDLFKACDEACGHVGSPGRSPTVLTIIGERCFLLSNMDVLATLDDAALVVPLLPIIEQVRAKVLQRYESQAQLPL